MKTKCPICGNATSLNEEPIGPFCSERCKLVDLGRWFGEDYKVSEPLRPDRFEGFEDLNGEDLDKPNSGRY